MPVKRQRHKLHDPRRPSRAVGADERSQRVCEAFAKLVVENSLSWDEINTVLMTIMANNIASYVARERQDKYLEWFTIGVENVLKVHGYRDTARVNPMQVN